MTSSRSSRRTSASFCGAPHVDCWQVGLSVGAVSDVIIFLAQFSPETWTLFLRVHATGHGDFWKTFLRISTGRWARILRSTRRLHLEAQFLREGELES